jgi:hypothetical protein
LYRYLIILALVIIVLMLFARFLRRVTASFLNIASAGREKQEPNDPKKDIVYSKDDVIVMKGESKRNNEEDL